MEGKDYKDRISDRTDLVFRLTHLTRGNDDDQAFENLWKIVTEKKLLGSGKTGFIVGDSKATCFQEVPLYSIVENLRFEERIEGRKRYSWFGLRFNKIRMYNNGARPVIYGITTELKDILPPSEYWRIVKMDLNSDQIIDWSHEREWRVKGDFAFEYDDIEILVKDDEYYRRFVKRCFEQDRKDIIEGVHGIVPLNTVIL